MQHLDGINIIIQSAFTCSKLTVETLEQGVKYVQSQQQRHQNDARRRSGVFIVNFEHILGVFIVNFELILGVFIVNFEHILQLVLVFLLLTLNMKMPTGLKQHQTVKLCFVWTVILNAPKMLRPQRT